MNLLLLYPEEEVSPGRFRFGGERAAHIRNVLKKQVGDSLKAGLLNGPVGQVKLVLSDGASCEVEGTLDGKTALPKVDFLIAMPRPKSLRKLLPQLAAMGARKVTFFRTARVEKSYLQSDVLAAASLQKLCRLGLMQGGHTREPIVKREPLFRPYVEDRLPGELHGRLGLVAHPYAAQGLERVHISDMSEVLLAIGPEGGFLPFEMSLLEEAGMVPITMGERILRVETACVAFFAQIDLLRRMSG